MTFANDKKTFLAKADKSKKGDMDEKVISLVTAINSLDKYYTTSSCSGRTYLWRGSGKKNETEWLNVSHDYITPKLMVIDQNKNLDLIWLRVEPFIMHICCVDLEAAAELLEQARIIYKKSSIISIAHKIIVEIRGSEVIEMPLYNDGKLLWDEQLELLVELVNTKLGRIFNDLQRFEVLISNIKKD